MCQKINKSINVFFFSNPKSTEQNLRLADNLEPWCLHKMPSKLYVDIKNDVYVVPDWNQTPSHAASSAQLPQNTQNSAFIGICHTLIQSLVESFPLWWGGCSLGMSEYCRWALERTSRACVCMSSFVPRHLCHVFFSQFLPCGLNTKWHISCVFTLTHGSATVRPIIFTIGWECHATDVSLGRKHLKAKGRIFIYPVWEVTSFWV